MQIKKAVRHSVNLIVGLSGVSGSGKTYSALLLAAGLAGPNGKVGFIDTENGRGCMYADDPGILAALPQGYSTIELTEPFSPKRYIEALDAFEREKYSVVIIDSGSHEWEGIGGCTEIAERNKRGGMDNWALAKKEHKHFVLRLLNSSMHVIVCLRAREKVKILSKEESPDGRQQVIPLGLLPVAEKNFVYELIVSFMVQEGSHEAQPLKLPDQFKHWFKAGQPISKEHGERIRKWNEMAEAMGDTEKLQRQAVAAARQGLDAYKAFYGALSVEDKRTLSTTSHADNRRIAEEADAADADANEEAAIPMERVS